MPHINRIVIGLNEEKKSAVILRDSPNHQEVPGMFWRSTLWATTELPVDNQVPGDRSVDVVIREPEGNGLIFRTLELPPDPKDTKKHIEILQDLDNKVKQKYPPTEQDLARHPSMHRTDTCDMFVIVSGEVYLMTDTDETLLKTGDTAVVKGVNHAWSNRSDKPCRIVGVGVHANPLPEDWYSADGL
jgi:mannose-6-phosphate isomerase-like protein (cupin superfamily)